MSHRTMQFLGAYVGFPSASKLVSTYPTMIFSYNHNKYEECTAILDTRFLSLIKTFLNGAWTASVKRRNFHNLALDKAHESITNLRIESITSELSNLDKIGVLIACVSDMVH